MDPAKEKGVQRKQLNPVLMKSITSNYLFRKQADLKQVPPRRLSKKEVETKFQLLFVDSQWNRAFQSVAKSLRHIVIDRWNVFYVSGPPHGHRGDCKTLEVDDDILRYLFKWLALSFKSLEIVHRGQSKTLEVDDDILRYMFKRLALNFKSLKITATTVETVTGKNLFSTAAIIAAGIDGLSELTFRCLGPDKDFERFVLDAGTIIRRNVATLGTLRCHTAGATFAKLLPPDMKLKKFEARGGWGWTLADVATVLGTNAVSIELDLSSSCSSLEYPLVETFTCRRLAVNWSLSEDCEPEQLVSLLECIGASARDLESFEMTLTADTVECEGKDFFAFADKIIKALASGIDKLAFPWPSTFCVNFRMNYLENVDGIEFARLFSSAYPPAVEVDHEFDDDDGEFDVWYTPD